MQEPEELESSETLQTDPSDPHPPDHHAQIAHIAYCLWLKRGGGDSTPEQRHEDWIAAEKLFEHGLEA